ncbi:MAG: NosD domain-containing protein, partial [Ferruginibacter sp.]
MKYLLLIACLLVCCAISANTIHVGPAKRFKSVTAGLYAALAGDTVLVHAGHYKEKNLLVSKAVVLKGINYPVLDGENKYEIISINASGVVIEGFIIAHSGISSLEDLSGIKTYECRDVIIRGNRLEDTFFGIFIQGGINCRIENNQLRALRAEEQPSGTGLHCWKSDNLQIIGNTVSGHRDGIYFEFVKNSIIWRNTASNNLRYGLHFMFSNDDTYVGNIFSNNGSGVSVMYSNRIKMFSNYFEENIFYNHNEGANQR